AGGDGGAEDPPPPRPPVPPHRHPPPPQVPPRPTTRQNRTNPAETDKVSAIGRDARAPGGRGRVVPEVVGRAVGCRSARGTYFGSGLPLARNSSPANCNPRRCVCPLVESRITTGVQPGCTSKVNFSGTSNWFSLGTARSNAGLSP